MAKDASRLVAGAAVGFFGSMYVLRFLRWLAEGPVEEPVRFKHPSYAKGDPSYKIDPVSGRTVTAAGEFERGTLESAFYTSTGALEGQGVGGWTTETISDEPYTVAPREDQPHGVLLPARRGGQPVFRR